MATGPATSSLQVGQDRLRLHEVTRIEALAQASTDGFEDVTRLGALALLHPKSGQISRHTKLERPRLLAAGRSQSLVEQRLHLGVRCPAREQRTGLQSIQLHLEETLAVMADDREPVVDCRHRLRYRFGVIA